MPAITTQDNPYRGTTSSPPPDTPGLARSALAERPGPARKSTGADPVFQKGERGSVGAKVELLEY